MRKNISRAGSHDGSSVSRSTTPTENLYDTESVPQNTIEALPPSKMVFWLAALTSFCGFMFGYDTGYISSALVAVREDLGHSLSSGDKQLITAATSLGAFCTAVIGGALADLFGRKYVITFSNVMFMVGGAVQTGAHTVWTMIVGRYIMGFGVGLASLVAPMYLSEVAPTRYRGRLVVINVLAITLGQLIAYAIGYGLEKKDNGWRILVGLSLIPPFVQMVLFFFMPETPRYLILRRRNEEARRVLQIVYAGADDQQLTDKINEISSDIPRPAVTSTENPTFAEIAKSAVITYRHNLKELFVHASNRRGLAIIVSLQLLQQFSGWNALMYYSATIFQGIGFDNPTATSIIIAGTNFVFTVVAFCIIDRFGRRKLLLISQVGMCAGLIVCAIAFKHLKFVNNNDVETNGISSTWGTVVIVFIFFYAASYAIGIGNVPWQQSEMLPMEVRGVGVSGSTSANWAGSLVVSATFLTMLNNITPTGTFAFYAGICGVGFFLVLFFYPETAGLNLEEIQQLLQGGFNVRKSLTMHAQKQEFYRSNANTRK